MCCPCCEPFWCDNCDVTCQEDCNCYDANSCGFCLELWSEHTETERISCERDLDNE